MSDLSTRLREGTEKAHTMTENTPVMKCLLAGIIDRESLRKFFADLYFVYQALEQALQQNTDNPSVGALYFPELNRTANLACDLEYYYGATWQEQIAPSPAAYIYCQWIDNLAQTDPILLVAHAYTRYLGDLSGGQGLKPAIRSALSLTTARGTEFYDFYLLPTPASQQSFQERYHQALDDLPLDTDTIDRIVAEANMALTLNRGLISELTENVKAAIGNDVFDVLARQNCPSRDEFPFHHPVATAQ